MAHPSPNPSVEPLAAIPLAKLEYQNPNSIEGLGSYWREGKSLRVVDGAVLPCRCVKCNTSLDVEMRKRKLYWYPQWTFLLIFLNIVIFAIVAFILRKRVIVTYGLCAKHRRMRVWGAICGISGITAGIADLYLSGGEMAYVLTGLATILVSIAAGAILLHVFRVEVIRNGSAWLRGVSADFLDTL